MRANCDRSKRLAFDAIPEEYSAGRPDFATAIVERVVAAGGWQAGDHIIEVGAGTGQLTVPLLRHQLHVTAVEPGPALAGELSRRTRDLAAVEVANVSFEEYRAREAAAGIVAANSFHWLDPTTAYDHAAGMLCTDGSLVMMWNFPVAADDEVQRLLNERAWIEPLEDLRREPAGQSATLDRALAEGREELVAAACFTDPEWTLTTIQETWALDRVAAFSASLASTAGHLGLIEDRLDGAGLDDPISMLDRVYICAARRR